MLIPKDENYEEIKRKNTKKETTDSQLSQKSLRSPNMPNSRYVYL